VNKDGSISNIEILRDIGYGCKKEVIRVLHLMPNWIPGQMDGVIVRFYYYLPVAFKLSKVPVDTIYSICDSMPKFPGGEKKMNKFILANNKYAAKNNEDKIFDVIQFVVDTDGSLLQPMFLINGSLKSDSKRYVLFL